MRTQEEIDRQIDGLEKMKSELPEFNYFGENNHEPIDVQLAILREDAEYEDYEHDEYNIESAAMKAKDWLEDENGIEEDLFEE